MKDKLTLTVDRAAIQSAKAYAKREGTSLSALVEHQFQQLGSTSFGRKWQGKFKLPKPDPKDPRLNYLLRKYAGAAR